MAYPGDPSSPDIGASTILGGHGPTAADVGADDLERLAASFRPSWELDDAPFTGAAAFSAAEVRALQNGEARQAVRKTLASSTNEAFAPPIRSDGPARRVSSIPPARPTRDVVMPAFPPMRAPALSLDFETQARQFRRRPPWAVFALIGALVVGGGAWLASSGVAATPTPKAPDLPHPATVTTAAPLAPAEPTPAIPAPPPAAAEAPRSEPTAPPPVANEGVPPSPPLTRAPQSTPTRTSAPSGAAAPARSAPVAKPAARPKATGGTIVRDVPF